MFVTSCPACGDAVTVPSRARPTSQMRCPLCSTEFTLEELLSTLPPMLELIGDEPEEVYYSGGHTREAQIGGEEAGGVATMVANGTAADYATEEASAELALAEAEPRAVKPSYSFEGGAAAGTAGTRGSVSSSARPKKKGKNALVEGIKVILGGVAAIPIAIGILWFGFGQDPFEAGPAVAKYAPWAVPAKFQGKTPEPKNDAAANGNKQPENKKTENKIKGLPKVDNTEIPALELGPDPNFPAKDPNDLSGAGGLAPPAGLDIDPLQPPDDGETKKKEAAVPAPIDAPAASLDPASTNPASTPEKLEVANAPKYTGPELAEALSTATKHLQAFDEGEATADVNARKGLIREMYKSLAQLGEKATFADRDDAEVTTQMLAIREFLGEIQNKPKVLDVIAQVAPIWATAATAEVRGTNGVIIVGTLEEKAADDKSSTHRFLTGDAKHPEVNLVISPERARAGVKALVLGAIVEEPTLAIPGFVGDEQRVVFGDFLVPFPAQ